MSLYIATGTFAKSTGAATVAQDVACVDGVTGITFDPKCVILVAGLTATVGSLVANAALSIGLSDGTNEYSGSIYGTDGAVTTNQRDWSDTKALNILKAAAGTEAECDVTLGSGKFTASWTTNNANAYRIGFIALGGTDITNVKAGTFTMPTAGGAPVTGLGFKPDMLFMLSTLMVNTTATNNSMMSLGVAAAPVGTYEAMMGNGVHADRKAFGASNTTQTGGSLLALIRAGGTNIDYVTTVTFDADGFSLGFNQNSNNASHVAYLAIKGGSYYCGNQIAPAATGNFAVSGVGFTPKGLLFGWADTSITLGLGPKDNSQLGFGAADSAQQMAFMQANADNVDPTISKQRNESANCLVRVLSFDVTTPFALKDLASWVSMDSDGYTLNFSTVTSGGYGRAHFGYLAFGDNLVARRRFAGTVI